MEVRKKLLYENEKQLYDLTFPFTLSWGVIPSYKRILMLAYVRDYTTELWRKKIAFLFYLLVPVSTRRIITDIKDYIRIDDFYSTLAERDNYIRYNQLTDDILLVKRNKKCLELAVTVLKKIDWIKYK